LSELFLTAFPVLNQIYNDLRAGNGQIGVEICTFVFGSLDSKGWEKSEVEEFKEVPHFLQGYLNVRRPVK
jgi:hypothetical protein